MKSPKSVNLGKKKLQLGARTLIMGILNVTPDSFSDGGKYLDREKALIQADRMTAEGADIIDIGGESTRPGYAGISAQEEWARIEAVVRQLVSNCLLPLSVDTQKAEVAKKALEAGVQVINDIWGLQRDSQMAEVIAGYNASVIIMHNKDNTVYSDIMREILAYLSRSIEIALKHGIEEEKIIIDPGIGFGKTWEQNIEVLRKLQELRCLGYPILLGVSRKSVIGRTLNIPLDERLEPTIALGALGIAAGVDILRVHDVLENKKAALMVDQIVRRR